MATTADRNTPHKDGKLLEVGVAAATTIHAGAMVARNSAGYLVPAADAAGLAVLGMAEEAADNSGGADGDLSVPVRRKRAFRFANSAANPVTLAHLGTAVYVEDDETVASAGGTNSIVAGTCLDVDSGGVWVEIG